MVPSASTEDLLARVPLFRDLSPRQLRRVGGLMTGLDQPAGAVLTREGTPGSEFFVVLEGAVEVRRGTNVVTTLGPGDYFGEIALLSRRLRTATVVATTPVAVQVLDRREFATLLADEPDIAEELLATMAERLAELGVTH